MKVAIVYFLDKGTSQCYIWISSKEIMSPIQLLPNLRYLPLSDESGDFGIFIVHDGDTVRYTIEIQNREELEAALASFQGTPPVARNW